MITALGGQRQLVQVHDPLGQLIEASYGLIQPASQSIAIIELAQASGLTLVPPAFRDPTRTSTYGTGELILAACQAGAKEIWIGLGGSATTDGGVGLASALGFRFLDQHGCPLPPGGLALTQLASIDTTQVSTLLKDRCFRVLCDVANPLIGPQGAAAIFGPQKGASPLQVVQLDAALTRLAEIMARDLKVEVAQLPGAGAAGGTGAGLVGCLGATLESGIAWILEATKFDQLVRQADLVITGEGCLDEQSLMGKVMSGVLAATTTAHKPLVILAGTVKLSPVPESVIALDLVSVAGSVEAAMQEAANYLEIQVAQSLSHVWFRLISEIGQNPVQSKNCL